MYDRVGSTAASRGGGGGGPPPPPTGSPNFSLGIWNISVTMITAQWLNTGDGSGTVGFNANLTNSLGQTAGVFQAGLHIILPGQSWTFSGAWSGGAVPHGIYVVQMFLVDSAGIQVGTPFAGQVNI